MKINVSGRESQEAFNHHMSTLMKMFAWMEVCGLVGSSSTFEIFYDGDGRAKLEFDFGELQSV